MKKKLSAVAGLLFAVSCLPLNASAVAWEYNTPYYGDTYALETENFKYQTTDWGMTLETDLTDANYMITGVFYKILNIIFIFLMFFITWNV